MICFQCRAVPATLRPSMTAATRIPISAHAAAAARASTARATTTTTTTTTSIRTLITSSSAFSPLRAQLSHQPRTPSTILSSTSAFLPSSTITSSPAAQQQSRSFSASACLLGKRSTYNPSRRVQKRRHGFLSRVKTRTGRMIIQRRKARGRKNLSW